MLTAQTNVNITHWNLSSADHHLPSIKPSLTVAKSFAGDDHSITLIADDRSSGNNIAFRTQIESDTIHSRLTASSPVEPAISRTLSNASEATETGFEREVDTIRRALVDDVEVQARVVHGVIEGGVVVALSNIDALVEVAEVVESFVCDGFFDGCCGAVAIQFAGLQAWAELICGRYWWDLDLVRSQSCSAERGIV
jgi:hypothetical protein